MKNSGGIYDNTGIESAVDVLDQVVQKKHQRKLIVIDDSQGLPDFRYKGSHRFSIKPLDFIWYGLDAHYNDFYYAIKDWCIADSAGDNDNINFAVLDFRTLLKSTEDINLTRKLDTIPCNDIIDKKSAQDTLLNRYRGKDCIPPIADRILLFELVSNFKTQYEATTDEKDILVLAGRIVVRMQKNNLLKVLQSNTSYTVEADEKVQPTINSFRLRWGKVKFRNMNK